MTPEEEAIKELKEKYHAFRQNNVSNSWYHMCVAEAVSRRNLESENAQLQERVKELTEEVSLCNEDIAKWKKQWELTVDEREQAKAELARLREAVRVYDDEWPLCDPDAGCGKCNRIRAVKEGKPDPYPPEDVPEGEKK